MQTFLTWAREIAGWVLIGVGLGAFALCYLSLLQNHIISGVICGFVGLTIFRGGMAMLKLAIASRAARDVQREMAAQAAPVRKVRPQLGSNQAAGRPRRSVLPGPGRN